MIKIYSDAAYDLSNKIACYCIVVVDEVTNEKTWQVHRLENIMSSNGAEIAALRHALRIAKPYRKASELVVAYTDCEGAIKKCGAEASADDVELRHVHAHRISAKNGTAGAFLQTNSNQVTEDRKRQHWADIMAYKELQKVLDLNKHEHIVKV